MIELYLDHDVRPNDYRVWKGKIVIPPHIQAQREELGFMAKSMMSKNGLNPTLKPCCLFIYVYRNQDPMKDYFGDCDNFSKWVADALTGIVYANDAQVQELHVRKFKSLCPGLLVRVEEIEGV